MSLNEKQQQFFDMAMNGKNLFITGSAGVGKSYLVNAIIKAFEAQKKRVIVCATTGVAARNIGGYTLHHQFHINVATERVDSKKNGWLEKTDLIVIDEISMLSFHLFDRIGKEIEAHNPKCQLIVVGDFFQLPPIIGKTTLARLKANGYNVNEDNCHCFHAVYWQKFNFQTCVLTEAMRQDDQAFSDVLYNLSHNEIRKQDLAYVRDNRRSKPITDDDAITLGCTNAFVNGKNAEELAKIKGEEYHLRAKKWGDYDKNAVEEELVLKVGAKVMLLVNNLKAGYCNGDIGFIRSIDEDEIVVELTTGDTVIVEPYKFATMVFEGEKPRCLGYITQFPLRLAWAITVHKSQGQTYNKVNFFFDRGFSRKDDPNPPVNLTLLYVGMSRCRSVKDLFLRQQTNPIFCNQEIVDFYNGKYETYYSKREKDDLLLSF